MTSCHHAISVHLADHSDQYRWDTYVLHHPDSSSYHLFAWKYAVEESYGHSCHYLYGENQGQLVGVLPLIHLKFLGVVDELVALPYCDVGNCLCDSETVQDALLQEAFRLRNTLNIRGMSLRGPLKETALKNTLLQSVPSEKVRMLLNLPSSSAELFAGFKSKLRSQIHKAEKNRINFKWGTVEQLDDLYAVFSRNMHDLGSPVHAKRWFKGIMTHYSQRIKVGLVTFEEKTVGVGIILMGGRCVSIPWASTLRDYNSLGPNMLLYWKFLEFSADNGFEIFDFGRSTEHEGTYRFKRQWGAEPIPLVWHVPVRSNDNNADHFTKQSTARRMVETLWRKSPLAVANILGPCVRKYISL